MQTYFTDSLRWLEKVRKNIYAAIIRKKRDYIIKFIKEK